MSDDNKIHAVLRGPLEDLVSRVADEYMRMQFHLPLLGLSAQALEQLLVMAVADSMAACVSTSVGGSGGLATDTTDTRAWASAARSSASSNAVSASREPS